MKFSTWSILISSIFIMLAASATLSTNDYVNLISDLYNLYKPSSLTLIHLIDRQDFSQMNTISNMQILLSIARIMTNTLKLEAGFLPNDYIKSLRNFKQPMNVVFITSERDVKKMKDLSKELSFYGIINLILFVKAFESPLIDSCMNPVGNPFLLSEGDSFFVKCYEDIAIREWYAFNENQLTIIERFTWEPAKGLVLKSKKLMQTDNDILNEKVLRIGRYSISEKFDKYFNDLFLALKLAGNFKTENVEIEADFGIGSWNKTSKTWSGGLGLIQNHEIDILAQIVPTNNEILDSADLTVPLKKVELCLFIRKPTSRVAVLWSGYLKPFTYKTWCALIVSLIVTVTLLTFLRVKLENGSYHGNIQENFLHVWGYYFQQGLPEFPKALALRLFYYSTSLFGFFIFGIYSASFVSELTVLEQNLPFKSTEEFLEDRSYKLAIIGSQLYEKITGDRIRLAMQKKLIKRNQSPRNTQDALNLICSRKIALYSTDIITSRLPDGTKLPCNLVKIGLERHIYMRMAMPKNSRYKKAINYYIMKLRGNGILRRIESTLQESSGSEIFLINAPSEQNFQPTTILDIASLLAMFCGSIILSILILFFEDLYFTVRKRKSVKISTRPRPGAARIRKLN